MTLVEFSRQVAVAHIGEAEAVYDIVANEAERAALARRFALLSLDRLEASVRLRRVAGGMIRLDAVLSAESTQESVVTLDPVPSRVEEHFSLLYGKPGDDPAALDPEAEIVEPIEGGRIDLGEAVAQQLSLALDPYPRGPEADG